MDYKLGTISLIHLHAVEETIRYVGIHGEKATYEGVANHINWYWTDTNNKQWHQPQGWMFDWIKCLTGE